MSQINILITTFKGTSLPPTLSFTLPSSTPISDLFPNLDTRLPQSLSSSSLLLSTLSSRFLSPSSPLPISSLTENDFLSLRLSTPLCGGKGGFGSQLRAAGGRMSKRKKTQEDNGSSRNLDGRRLRTVNEAKALAEYLAIKPDMDRKEKEKRRARLEEIVEMAERKQEEIKYGSKKVGLDGKWVEEKEVMGEKTREAVLEALKRGGITNNNFASSSKLGVSLGSSSGEDAIMEGSEEEEGQGSGSGATTPPSEVEPEQDSGVKGKGKEKEKAAPAVKIFFGFDEDDEFMSSDEESEDDESKK
ncbi:telomere stability and silencing-domain-containing protein [Podospora fimiseda]|uniref:Telomere stability and silencing-domain-containing protein n=1 Tax=Podospora fimiseda TaxID=252190 RepID=A0AAN7H0G8_9PEZI|nr:telomere stability and silencing-domain-containing protein [Podospora fimiseda]